MKSRFLTAGLLLALASAASALEYRTTGRPALLYDAPSTAAGRVAVAGARLPLEVVVETADWVKVRDHNGRLAWIEGSALAGTRHVMVNVETSAVRRQPRSDADVVFHAARGVLLEAMAEPDSLGWMRVRHADGLTGWLLQHEVWGR